MAHLSQCKQLSWERWRLAGEFERVGVLEWWSNAAFRAPPLPPLHPLYSTELAGETPALPRLAPFSVPAFTAKSTGHQRPLLFSPSGHYSTTPSPHSLLA